MGDARGQACLTNAIDELKQAARVGVRYDRRTGGADVLELPIQELVGHLGLDKVVDV